MKTVIVLCGTRALAQAFIDEQTDGRTYIAAVGSSDIKNANPQTHELYFGADYWHNPLVTTAIIGRYFPNWVRECNRQTRQ